MRNPNVRKCNHCGAISSTPTRDGRCQVCRNPYGQSADVEVIDPDKPLTPDGKNAEPPPKVTPEVPFPVTAPQPENAPAPAPVPAPQHSELTMHYVTLGRKLEAPTRALLDAYRAARETSKAKAGPTKLALNKELREALDEIEDAFSTPGEQKRRAFEKAFRKACELVDAGQEDEAFALVADVFE